MDQTKDSTKKRQPTRPNCFLGCFGFSGDVSKEKPSPAGKVLTKRRKWFSWVRNHRSTTRTVPVDSASAPEKASRSWSKRDKKVVNGVDSSRIPAGGPGLAAQKANKTKYDSAQDIILENRKSLSSLDSINDTTCQKGYSSARKSSARRSYTHPASPDATPRSVLPLSVSLPPPPKGKKNPAAANGGGDPQTTTNQSKEGVAGKVDSVVGMSIILITLLILLVWGKACAILCTSAWFYFLPRFRPKNGPKGDAITTQSGSRTEEIEMDLSSEEYKKKVVLEGLLERNNHRN